jgi:hypothetical protein
MEIRFDVRVHSKDSILKMIDRHSEFDISLMQMGDHLIMKVMKSPLSPEETEKRIRNLITQQQIEDEVFEKTKGSLDILEHTFDSPEPFFLRVTRFGNRTHASSADYGLLCDNAIDSAENFRACLFFDTHNYYHSTLDNKILLRRTDVALSEGDVIEVMPEIGTVRGISLCRLFQPSENLMHSGR